VPLTINIQYDGDTRPEELLALSAFFSDLAGVPRAAKPTLPTSIADTLLPPTTQPILVPAAEYIPTPLTTLPSALPTTVADADVPEPPPSANPPACDKLGLRWDERIHSSSKAINVDGTWRQRRGVDPRVVEQVEAELRGLVAGRASVPPPPPMAPVPEPPPVALPPVAPSSGNAVTDLMMDVSKAMAAGAIDMARVEVVCRNLGLPGGLPTVAQAPHFIPAIRTALGL
jgi:hypothetical protein